MRLGYGVSRARFLSRTTTRFGSACLALAMQQKTFLNQ